MSSPPPSPPPPSSSTPPLLAPEPSRRSFAPTILSKIPFFRSSSGLSGTEEHLGVPDSNYQGSDGNVDSSIRDLNIEELSQHHLLQSKSPQKQSRPRRGSLRKAALLGRRDKRSSQSLRDSKLPPSRSENSTVGKTTPYDDETSSKATSGDVLPSLFKRLSSSSSPPILSFGSSSQPRTPFYPPSVSKTDVLPHDNSMPHTSSSTPSFSSSSSSASSSASNLVPWPSLDGESATPPINQAPQRRARTSLEEARAHLTQIRSPMLSYNAGKQPNQFEVPTAYPRGNNHSPLLRSPPTTNSSTPLNSTDDEDVLHMHTEGSSSTRLGLGLSIGSGVESFYATKYANHPSQPLYESSSSSSQPAVASDYRHHHFDHLDHHHHTNLHHHYDRHSRHYKHDSLDISETSTTTLRASATPSARLALSSGVVGPPGQEDRWDYSETEWWGWIILLITWVTFVTGMGSCLGVWTWAWDVGKTPYAPPEFEDDPTLPITGYYPALIILSSVMAWGWVLVAWVGMKYFRHAKLSGD